MLLLATLGLSVTFVVSAATKSYGTCSHDGLNGICIDTGVCSSGGGSHTAGLCPGPGSIQCCTYGTCNVPNRGSGKCGPTSLACSGGTYTAGFCPGPSNIECCTTSSVQGVGDECTPYTGISGTCLDDTKSSCAAGFVTGICSGPASVRCCPSLPACSGISGKCQNKDSQSCSSSYVAGHCPGPETVECCPESYTTGIGDSCTVDGVSGICQLTSTACSGGSYHADYCEGPADVQCCTKNSGGGGTGCGTPTIDDAGTSLIKQYEGFVPSPRGPDPIGLPTVGYGHKCQQTNCAEVTAAGYTFPLTETTASELLMSDLKGFGACLIKYCPNCVLNTNQYAALVSWTMNIGCGQMESSTLIKDLNEGDNVDSTCASQLPQWDTAGGSVLQGLVNRRAAEVKLCQDPTSTQATPPKC